MKYIKSFNESIGDFAKEVRQVCDDSLAYLKDEGFTYITDLDNDGEALLYINGSKEVKFVDILPDLQPFIELLSEISIIKDIDVSFYFKTLNGYELRDSARSRNAKSILTVNQILNDEFDKPIFNIPGIIIFRFELEKKKVPFLSKIKSFFSK
jgi:hypothetical protein